MIIGSCHTELVTYVKELPMGNEDIVPVSQSIRTAGGGYLSALVLSKLNMKYALITETGSGDYADLAAKSMDDEGIIYPERSEELAGCSYRMIDEEGNEGVLYVAGNEYDFNLDSALEADPEEMAFVLLDTSVLSGENADELLRYLEDLEKPVYAVLKDRLDAIEENALEALLSLNPVLILDENDSWIAGGEFSDVRDAASEIAEMNGNTVMILSREGVYCREKDDTHFAECEDDTDPYFFAAGYLAARLCGISHKNSLIFGLEAGSKMTDSFTPEEEDLEDEKKRLAEMILHE